MKCWQCDAEPVEAYALHTGESAGPVRTILVWPEGGDHSHAEAPPTPEEIADSAYAMLTNPAS